MLRISKYKINIAGMLAFVVVVIILLAINWNYYKASMQENERSSKVQTEMMQLGQELKSVSDELTYMTRNYLVTQDISYFKGYWDIVLNDEGRLPILDKMEAYDLEEEEHAWMQELRDKCNELEMREVYAMQMFLPENISYEVTHDKTLLEYISYVKAYSFGDMEWNVEAQPGMKYLIDEDYKKCSAELMTKTEEFVHRMQGNLVRLTIQMNENSRRTAWAQVICIVMVGTCMVLLLIQNRKVYALRNMNEIIAAAVTEEYLNFGLVNLNNCKVVKLKRINGEIRSVESNQNFVEMMEAYMNEQVNAAYQENFIHTIQPGYILSKLANDQQIVSCVYKNIDDKWLMLDFTKSREYSEDNPVIIYTFKNAGEIIQQQKEQRQRDEMLMYFSRDFFEVYVVDLNQGSYEIIRSAERYGNYIKNLTGDFAQLMQLAIVSWTTPPYRGMFKQLMDVQDIKGRFASGAKKIEFIYKSYDEKWKNLQCFPVPDYGIGNERMIFALRDYTEEMQIRTNEVLASEAMNNIYSLVVFRDIEANKYECIHCSEKIHDFQEKGSYEALVQEILSVIHEEDREKYLRELSDERFERNGRAECEFRMRDKEGCYHYYHEYITKVEIPSGTRMAILVKNIDESKMHEIWEAEQLQKELKAKAKELEMAKLLAEKSKDLEKALKQAESANDAKSRFMSNMSHDLRTPMNAILGMTYLAKKHMNDEEQMNKCLNTILSSSENMVALINDVLDMNKIESGIIELHEKPANLEKLVYDIELFFRNKCENNQQEFVIDCERVIHKNLLMDELRIKQILTNLVSNAVKYTQSFGKISLEVIEDSCDEEGNCSIRFIITDDGIGMSEEFVKKVFQPFEREETVLSEKIEGTGLGMAIVKNFVEVMNGNITINSMVNFGTKVVVVIPLKICDDVETIFEKDFSTVQHKYPGKHILIVEDKRINMEIVKGFLEDTELIIDEARNGKDAVEKFKESEEGTYDLIFMDIRMPIMKGDEATAAIRALEREDSQRIPIIAMTANALESDVENSFRSGMNGHISKPIEPDEVYRCLNKWLLGSNREDAS